MRQIILEGNSSIRPATQEGFKVGTEFCIVHEKDVQLLAGQQVLLSLPDLDQAIHPAEDLWMEPSLTLEAARKGFRIGGLFVHEGQKAVLIDGLTAKENLLIEAGDYLLGARFIASTNVRVL